MKSTINAFEYGRSNILWMSLFILSFLHAIPGISSTYLHLFVLLFVFYIFFSHLLLKKADLNTTLILIGFLWIIIQLLTFANSSLMGNFSAAIRSSTMYFLRYLALFALVANLKLNRKDIDRYFKVLAMVATLVGVYSLVMKCRIILITLSLSDLQSRLNFSPFGMNRNTFAGYMFVAFAAIIYLAARYHRKIYYVYASILLVSIFLTFSRTAVACSLIFFYIFNTSYFKFKWYKSLTTALILIALIMLVFLSLPNKLAEPIKYLLIRGREKFSGRDTLWNIGFESFLEKPILGWGYGSSSVLLRTNSSSLDQFHNMYLEILSSGGLVFFAMITGLIIHLNSLYREILKQDRLMGIVLNALLISVLIYGFFESILFFDSKISLIFTVILVTIPRLYLNSISTSGQTKLSDRSSHKF